MENTKDFILEEAFKLFFNQSYEAVSISDISKAIGFTKGALYHHFKNKEELFKSVVDKYLHIPEMLADTETISLSEYIQFSTSEAEKIIKKLFSLTLDFTPINYISMFTDAFRHYPGYSKLKGDFINNEIEKTKRVLENAIKSGEIRADINTSLIATNFFSINMGLAGNLVLNNSVDESISLLRDQNLEFYKLLKRP
ncbi:MAG TPA: TetR/AcrR family transcriptional regulator [Prolixibacteraceae bacterium]|nr:TetR/AcrR family transcriptional regulator [Prolixibacteraceae bacterium]